MQMYEEAIGEMETAVLLDPTLLTARLQVGLLHLTCANPSRALELLTPLADTTAEHPLACFARGLIHLIRDEFEATIDSLNRGIELNKENPALNNDMLKIITQVKLILSGNNSASTQTPSAATPTSDSQHLFISAYTSNKKIDS